MDEYLERQNALVKENCMNLYKSKGWIKLAGIVSIIQGGLIAFSIFGIIIAVLLSLVVFK